jgi:hypothetical protein
VSACGLQDVRGGAAPPGSPLNGVRTGFLPTAALAVRLGVQAGGAGGGAGAAAAELARLRLAGAQDAMGADCVAAAQGAAAAAAGRAEGAAPRAAPPAFYGGGWFHTNACPLELAAGGAQSTIAGGKNWALRDAAGFALRSVNNTGDWHMFAPAGVAAGGSRGYGQWAAQGENGGRFFTTGAFIWDALSSPWAGGGGGGGGAAPPGPYAGMADEWRRIVGALEAAGAALRAGAPGAPGAPLLPADRGFLSAPVADPLVFELCASVRAQFHFPNVTDLWGQRLCDYYQDLGWATPENGVVLLSFFKGLLGLHVAADGALLLLGARSGSWAAGSPPWRAAAAKPAGWPDVRSLRIQGLAVRGVSLDVDCDAASPQVACTVQRSGSL